MHASCLQCARRFLFSGNRRRRIIVCTGIIETKRERERERERERDKRLQGAKYRAAKHCLKPHLVLGTACPKPSGKKRSLWQLYTEKGREPRVYTTAISHTLLFDPLLTA
jgi:hypothetical protein